jgi:hypothetical protein
LSDNPRYLLAETIDRYLAALAKLYGQKGKVEEQSLLVNSQVSVDEAWSYDNWDGGVYGHALYLAVPESLYLSAVDKRDALQERIRDDLNKIHHVKGEFIAQVFLEMLVPEDDDWRRASGVLLSSVHIVSSDAERRVWGEGGYRVFLSHKAEIKSQAAFLKAGLRSFGVSAFVAHEDVHPIKEWQDEIENALATMDAFVPLMTERFHDSDWTDQEVGYALARRVSIVPVRLGKDPYGFIGKFQALTCPPEQLAKELVKLFIRHDRMIDAYIAAARHCESYDHGNHLAEILPHINTLSKQQVEALVSAYEYSGQLRGSFGFNGSRPPAYGRGLAYELTRITGDEVEVR